MVCPYSVPLKHYVSRAAGKPSKMCTYVRLPELCPFNTCSLLYVDYISIHLLKIAQTPTHRHIHAHTSNEIIDLASSYVNY